MLIKSFWRTILAGLPDKLIFRTIARLSNPSWLVASLPAVTHQCEASHYFFRRLAPFGSLSGQLTM